MRWGGHVECLAYLFKEHAMRYQVYLTNTREALKSLKMAGLKLSKKDPLKKQLELFDMAMLQSALTAGQSIPELAASIAGRTLLQERVWMTSERTTLFLDSPELVENLLKARFSFDDLPVPAEPLTFAIAVPHGCRHQGVEQAPILVTVGACRALEQEQFHMAGKIWGMDCMHSDRKGNSLAVMLTQRAPSSPRPELGHAYLSSYYTGEGLEAIVRSGSQEYAEIVTSKNDLLNMTLDEQENSLLVTSVRLALAAWVYWSACPESVVTGTPTVSYQDGDAPTLGKFKGLQMSAPRKHAGERDVGEHHRRWHFRQLRDQRYYQGEHAERAPGSRWVLIPETYVNRKAGEDFTATGAGL